MEALGFEETYGFAPDSPDSCRGGLRRGETNSRAQAEAWAPQRERSISIGHDDLALDPSAAPAATPRFSRDGSVGGAVLQRMTSENLGSAFGVIRRRLEATTCISSLLSSVDLVEMSRQCEVWTYRPGEPLMVEGCPGNFMLIVDEGSASVYKMPLSKSNESKDPSIGPHGGFVSTRVAGEIIGEVAIIASCPRTATVIANTKLTAVCVPRHVVLALCERNQHLANKLMEISTCRAVHLFANGPGKPFGGPSALALGLANASTIQALALGALVAVCVLVRSVRKT